MRKKIDGEHVLYHFLQKDLRESDIWLFQMLAARLVSSLGVWFSPEMYKRMPILVPYAVRDPTCRKRGASDTEEWGAPNELGLFRDDNSLIKNLPSSLEIRSPRKEIYSGAFLGSGFVACHIWQKTSSGGRASHHQWTNSFIPNLVWLPKQVAKLTDRPDSFSQTYLQALAIKLYRNTELDPAMDPFAKLAWEQLPKPTGIPEQGLPSPSELNIFEFSEAFLGRRLKAIKSVAEALALVASGNRINQKVISSRFSDGLPSVSVSAAMSLHKSLQSYSQAIEETSGTRRGA